MSALNLNRIRELHNKKVGQVPFDDLPSWRQEQVISYWRANPSFEALPEKKDLEIQDCRGKRFAVTRKIFEFLSPKINENPPSKVVEAREDDPDAEEPEPYETMPTEIHDDDQVETALEDIEAEQSEKKVRHGPINTKALELRDKVKSGDKRALNELFNLLMPLARGMTQNLLYYYKSDVDDVALQAMATMFDHIVNKGRWGEGKKITTFLRQFIRNASKNHARKSESRRRLAEIGIEEEHQSETEEGDVMYARGLATATEETPADAAISDEMDAEFRQEFLRAVREMIGSLPELERKVMTMHALEDRSPDEIASELNMDVSRVRKRIRRARRSAKKWLANKPEFRPLVNFFLQESTHEIFDPVGHLHRMLHPK